ncbi:MAG: DsbC family protein [Mariprofundaceae bacterium]
MPLFFIFAVMLLSASMLPAGSAYAESAVSAETELRLRKAMSDIRVDAIRPAPIEGLYEIQSGKNLYYTDRDGRHLIAGGHIFNTSTKEDLTAARLEEINRIDWSVLPLDKAIVSGDPNGLEMAVFTDPDCPYCRKLEIELDQLQGIKVYTFLYPLTKLHPKARGKAESIWCAKDQHKALKQIMLENKSLPKTSCETPIDALQLIGQQLNIHGTPTMIARDGRIFAGMKQAAQIKEWLRKSL